MPVITIGENSADDFSGCDDVYIIDGSNHEGGGLIISGLANSLLKFSGLNNISTTAIVNTATVYVNPTFVLNVSIDIRRILKNWIENEATLTICSSVLNWTVLGGEGIGNDIANTSTGTFNFNSIGYKSFNSSQFTEDIKNFINGNNSNYGWNFIGNSGFSLLTDSEGIDGSRPYLSLNYTESAPEKVIYYFNSGIKLEEIFNSNITIDEIFKSKILREMISNSDIFLNEIFKSKITDEIIFSSKVGENG